MQPAIFLAPLKGKPVEYSTNVTNSNTNGLICFSVSLLKKTLKSILRKNIVRFKKFFNKIPQRLIAIAKTQSISSKYFTYTRP